MVSGFCPRDAQAAGDAEIPGTQGHVRLKLSSDRVWSVRSPENDSGFLSPDEDAEEPLGAEDGSGTEHTELLLVPDSAGHKLRDLRCESETRPIKDRVLFSIPEDPPDPQAGSAARGTELPQVPDPAGHKLRDLRCEFETRAAKDEAVAEIAEDALGAQDGSAARKAQERTLGGFLGEGFRSHPLLTLLLLILLLALGVALAVQSGGGHRDIPVVPGAPVLLACPQGWVGYRGLCYFFSRDQGTWDQGQAQCSELGASLAMPKDEEMEFLFKFSEITEYWVGLRRRGQGLQWVDGSSFNSSVSVLGNAECVYLAESKFCSTFCSNPMPFICSRAQTVL